MSGFVGGDKEKGRAMSENQGAAKRSMWSGKWAFILAAAASAGGVGEMWGLPPLAAEDGGGTVFF